MQNFGIAKSFTTYKSYFRYCSKCYCFISLGEFGAKKTFIRRSIDSIMHLKAKAKNLKTNSLFSNKIWLK